MKIKSKKPLNQKTMDAITLWYEAFGNLPRCAAEYELLDWGRKAVFRRTLSPEAFFLLLMKFVPKEAQKEQDLNGAAKERAAEPHALPPQTH